MQLFLTLLLLLVVNTSAAAEIYRYVDENGKVHFTDAPPLDKKAEPVALQEPVKHGTPPPNEEAAKALFEQDRIKNEQLRRERIAAAKQRAKRKADKQQACDKARSDLARMKQYRAGARSVNSKRYYNKRVDMAKDAEDEACKLSNFR